MTDSATGHLWIRIANEADELRSLLDWLRHEDVLRGHVRPSHTAIEPGQMGGVLDALVVAVGSGGMGAVLAGALSTWILHRRADVKLTITSEDGRRVELDAKRVDAHIVMQDIQRLLDSQEP